MLGTHSENLESNKWSFGTLDRAGVKFAFYGLFSIVILIYGCNNENKTERYRCSSNEVKIGSQIWMSENLNSDRFRNGDLIPEAKTDQEWWKANENNEPAWCYYENDINNGARHGKLYNWHAINDDRGLAPKGWHVPSISEWETLIHYLGDDSETGTKIKTPIGWNDNGNGTNVSGFSGFPSGCRSVDGKIFDGIGNECDWWTSTDSTEEIFKNGENWAAISFSVNKRSVYLYQTTSHKGWGKSVRCIKD